MNLKSGLSAAGRLFRPDKGEDPEPGDYVLVKAVCDGDSRCFSLLMSRYQKRIRSLGMSFFKNSTDADDFVQDVFFKTYTNLKTFRGEAKFSTWLMRVAYNLAINSVKRRREYMSLSEETEIPDTDEGPEQRQLRRMLNEAVRTALTELPERYSVCIDMYFFYDLSYAEISSITDIPVNTVKSHVFRAKKMLREKLSDTAQEVLL